MIERKTIKRARRLDDTLGERWCSEHRAFITVDDTGERCHGEPKKKKIKDIEYDYRGNMYKEEGKY